MTYKTNASYATNPAGPEFPGIREGPIPFSGQNVIGRQDFADRLAANIVG
jgi:hypothetical protein